jgi:vacuolar protein sorting-associated protein 35
MDRLSSYAQREAETESPEQRKKTEEDSIAQLLEQMRIAKEKKAEEAEPAAAEQNGDSSEAQSGEEDTPTEASSTTAVSVADTEATETDVAVEKRRGIPSNVKLFEIFHEQVQTLVKMQRLPIQDTIGLLVSLANLAL